MFWNCKYYFLITLCIKGTIGITLSKLKQIQKVIGIELCSSAIEDARYNAELNGISNDRVSYHQGKVENVLPKVLHGLPETLNEIVAVLGNY